MRRLTVLTVLGILAAGVNSPARLEAQQADQSFELALFSPLQLRGQEDAIKILRLSLIYGSNVSVKGLDLGLVTHNSGGVSKGFQGSLVGIVEGDFVGWQSSGVSIVRGEFTGLQEGLYNEIGSGEAVQIGFINRARDVSGLQLGFVNLAENMYGVQIGLVNVIRSKDSLVFLPIVNWKF